MGDGDRLLGFLDPPLAGPSLALVLLVHGLGGDSEGAGSRRLAFTLQSCGCSVLRLNLRGAGEGRPLARGSYCACCQRDLHAVLRAVRRLAEEAAAVGDPGPRRGEGGGGLGIDHGDHAVPLCGVGLSLGGTILLNACLDAEAPERPLDRLVCISTPLDLMRCSAQIERPRNHFYQRWLLKRLRRQVLTDPDGVSDGQREVLLGPGRVRTIREFDSAIISPMWGFASVEHYYTTASPLNRMLASAPLPPTLLIHSQDDPWVPVAGTLQVARSSVAGMHVVVTGHGGHNGFHAPEDRDAGGGCWSDRLTARWLLQGSIR